MKRVNFGNLPSESWVIHSNGDCYNEYNFYYNVLTGKSNFKVFPNEWGQRLKREWNRLFRGNK